MKQQMSYLMAVVMFILSVTVYDIFDIDLDLDLFEWVKLKCKQANRLPMQDFLDDGNCNICSVYVYEIFAFETYVTLTFRIGQG